MRKKLTAVVVVLTIIMCTLISIALSLDGKGECGLGNDITPTVSNQQATTESNAIGETSNTEAEQEKAGEDAGTQGTAGSNEETNLNTQEEHTMPSSVETEPTETERQETTNYPEETRSENETPDW